MLSTAYRTPDVLHSVYIQKALQVLTADSRQRIVSRRVLTPKGDTEGGGGGGRRRSDAQVDFRVLAFWVGSVTTNASGEASIDVKLPESLTTYRIMAVAADRVSRSATATRKCGSTSRLHDEAGVPAVPRGRRQGARRGRHQPASEAGEATVTIRSLDPELLVLDGPAEQTLNVSAGGLVEARFAAAAKAVGRARVQMTVKL